MIRFHSELEEKRDNLEARFDKEQARADTQFKLFGAVEPSTQDHLNVLYAKLLAIRWALGERAIL